MTPSASQRGTTATLLPSAPVGSFKDVSTLAARRPEEAVHNAGHRDRPFFRSNAARPEERADGKPRSVAGEGSTLGGPSSERPLVNGSIPETVGAPQLQE